MANTTVTAQAIADLLSPPGETLQEALEERGMTQREFAKRTGRPLKTINEIIHGKGAITPDTAIQFEYVLGIPASFWLKRESQYREALARRDAVQRLDEQVGWLQHFPLRQMLQRGWLTGQGSARDQLREMLLFFSIASPAEWEPLWADAAVAFRRTDTATTVDAYALSAWLRQGERAAAELTCRPFDAQGLRQTLSELRLRSTALPAVYLAEIVERCAQVGVAVCYVPELPGMRTYGATHWLTSEKAILQLSLRQGDDGHFWFTFFHEAGHILLHGKKAFFIEDDQPVNAKEAEADRFAADFLIPPVAWQRFVSAERRMTKDAIGVFARDLGIAPGIVVGRLQREGQIPFRDYNGLKQPVRFFQERAE